MAKYTEEQKNAVLARIPEIGMSEAAKEAGVPVSTVSKWNKAAKAEESAFEISEEAYAEMIEGEAKEVDIIDAEREEAVEEKKEEIKDKADATKIETKKKARDTARKAKEKKEEAAVKKKM